jgi:SAM-dependent methyltransferase
MAQFHYVEDYERLVADLISKYPIEEAMSRAVGGGYNEIGEILAEVLIQNGLTNGMKLIDLGCGSGRAAKAISKRRHIEYLGIDIVQTLLDYAKTMSPSHYRFRRSINLQIEEPDGGADMICAFSLFTHLLHEETYIYLRGAHQCLKGGGKLVFSFLEFREPIHWSIFDDTVKSRHFGQPLHLNMFIERNVIERWSQILGFSQPSYIDATDQRWNGKALGQSVAVLIKQ